MKFAFVGSKANLEITRIGGIESTIRELVLFLNRNHEIHILVIDQHEKSEKVFPTEYGDINITTADIGTIRTKIISEYDVVNFLQSPFSNPFYACYFLFQKTFKAFITTKFFFTYPTLKNSTFLQDLKLKFLIDETFVFSKRLKNLAKTKTRNITMLYPPVSSKFKKGTKVSSDKKSILFVGRLSYDKGLDIVIDVFKQLSNKSFSLSIMGYFSSEDDKTQYEAELKKLKLDRLEIVQRNAENKTPYILNNYDILLLPYQDLGPTLDTPLLILEGLVSGCKIVTSNISPLNDIEGNIYFVDNHNNCKSFTNKILEIADLNDKVNANDYSSESFGKNYLAALKNRGLNV